MKNMLNIPPASVNFLDEYMRKNFYHIVLNSRNAAVKQFDLKRAEDRLCGIKNNLNISNFQNIKLLEIGAGAGFFIAYLKKKGIDAYGVEPDADALRASELLFQANNMENCLKPGYGESIPYQDKLFDIVVSFQVLEHTRDPLAVFRESERVLRDSGLLYFVVPNYRSFWEGHYGVPWFPWFGKKSAKIYVKVLGRNADLIDSINFVTPKKARYWAESSGFEIISMGGEEFYRNLARKEIREYWSSNRLLHSAVKMVRRARLSRIISQVAVKLDFFYPIILVARKIRNRKQN